MLCFVHVGRPEIIDFWIILAYKSKKNVNKTRRQHNKHLKIRREVETVSNNWLAVRGHVTENGFKIAPLDSRWVSVVSFAASGCSKTPTWPPKWSSGHPKSTQNYKHMHKRAPAPHNTTELTEHLKNIALVPPVFCRSWCKVSGQSRFLIEWFIPCIDWWIDSLRIHYCCIYGLIGSIDRLLDGLIDSLMDWLIHGLIGWLIDCLVDWVVDGLIHWLMDGLMDCLMDWLEDRSIDSMIDWLIDSLMDWLVDELMNWLIDWWVDWLLDWWVDGLNDGIIRRLVDWWVRSFMDPCVESVIDCLIDLFMDWFLDLLMGWFMAGRLIDGLIRRFIDSWIHSFMDWLVDRFIDGLINLWIHISVHWWIDSLMDWFIDGFIDR